MIGERIRQARRIAGLTLQQLGARVGVSHTAIQKYERGTLTPSSSQLLALAEACHVRTEYFFRMPRVELRREEFRKLSSFGKKAEEALRLKVIERTEQWVRLLEAFREPPIPAFTLPEGIPPRIDDLKQTETVAEAVRGAWKLGIDPIADLCNTLEALGFIVLIIDEDDPGFSGFTAEAHAASGRIYPLVAISSRWPGDRQRFTLAHELGHRLLSGRLKDDIDEEQACNRFAGAFLAPRSSVQFLLGRERRRIEWQELLKLKQEFGLSMQGWLMRARQCGVLSEAAHRDLFRRFSARGWRKKEPGPPLAGESSQLFEQLAWRALGEGCLAESKAAELLGIPLFTLQKKRRLELA